MTKFFNLIKVFLIQRYRPLDEKSKKRLITTLIVLAVCLIPMAVLLFIGVMEIGAMALAEGIIRESLSYIIFASQLVVLIFGISSVISIVYLSNDNVLLLAMPISPRTTFAAKITYVYINETIANLAFSLIALIPFGIGAQLPFWYYFQVLLVTLISPMLPLLLAVIVAIPLMYLVSFLKNKGVGATLVYLFLIIVIMGAYYFVVFSFAGNVGEEGEQTYIVSLLKKFASISKYLYPEYLLAGSLVATSFGMYLATTFGSIGISLGLLLISVLIASAMYKVSVSKQLEIPKSTKKQTDSKAYVRKGKVWALLKNDLLGILRDSSAGVNCLMPLILLPIMAGALGFGFSFADGEIPTQLLRSMPLFMSFTFAWMSCGCNYVAPSSFSREGTKFFLYKSMPISGRTLCQEKALISFIFMGVTSAITSIVLAIILKTTAIEAFLLFVVMLIWATGGSNIQILLDLRQPRLYWNTFVEGCKNNPAQLWGLLVSTLQLLAMGVVGGIFAVLYLLYGQLYFVVLAWSMLILFGLLYSAITYIILLNKSDNTYTHTEG